MVSRLLRGQAGPEDVVLRVNTEAQAQVFRVGVGGAKRPRKVALNVFLLAFSIFVVQICDFKVGLHLTCSKKKSGKLM